MKCMIHEMHELWSTRILIKSFNRSDSTVLGAHPTLMRHVKRRRYRPSERNTHSLTILKPLENFLFTSAIVEIALAAIFAVSEPNNRD